MILIYGDPDDLSAAYVGWLAMRRGIQVVELREDRVGIDWWFSIDGDRPPQIIRAAIGPLPIREITGAFVRLNPEPSVPKEFGIAPEAEFLYVQERRAAAQHLLDRLEFPIINRPSAGRSNGSKPFQMARLADLGLAVPHWIATNQADIAKAFMTSSPQGAVVKSCSGLRSHVRMASKELLGSLREPTAPVILQGYVEGHDVRVHVVAGATFCTSVSSPAVDYRFDESEVVYLPTDLPPELRSLCQSAAADEDLILAGFDFRVDSTGAWWCLEMNPVPTFLPYEAASGAMIGDAIVDVLDPMSQAPQVSSPLADRLRPAFGEGG